MCPPEVLKQKQETELRKRFETHSESELTTFLLQDDASLSTSPGMETSASIQMEITDLNYQEICSKFDITEEEFFLGCFLLTMRRYVGQNSVSFCIPVLPSLSLPAEQQHASENNFKNIMPIVTTLHMDSDLSEFFIFIKKEINFYNNFKSYPFTTLFHHLEKKDYEIYYRHMFTYQKTVQNNLFYPTHAKTSFSLEVNEDVNSNGISVTLTWAKSLLDAKVAKFFLQTFINCSRIMKLAEASSVIKQIDVLCDEQNALLASFQRIAPVGESKYASVVSFFDKNVHLNPEKISIYEASSQYTYAQLDIASRKIATALLEKFTPKNLSTAPIVLVMDKNFECIASVIGVWRAGGYFLPVDVNMQENLLSLGNPDNYLCIVTNLEKHQLHKETERWQVLQVKDFFLLNENFIDTSMVNQKIQIKPESPAYITKTSGSTGNPKKCIISHQGICQFISAASAEFNLDSTTNILQWVPFSFDVFIGDLVKSLFCTNGSLTMVSSIDRMNIEKISNLVSKFKVNFIQMTPQFALFALQEAPTLKKGIKTVVLGGETLSWKTLALLRDLLEDETRIYNCYGLTEATIESTAFQVPSRQQQENTPTSITSRSVPIGRPLPGIQVYVLDPITLLQMPIGASGIITIAGPTVASGELNTKLMGLEGEKLILTGDSGSWLTNGMLEFKGRENEKFVKVRGVRINCEELESRIMALTSSQAVALCVQIKNGEEFLAAALLSTQNSSITNLQNELRKVLPYYMVPQITLQLQKFPLTTNGKIDKKTLERLAANEYHRKIELSAAQETSVEGTCSSKTEAYLIQKLNEVSPRPSICTKMNLRDQGFTSFELMKFSNILIKKKVQNFQGISDIFTYPTLQLLAKMLDSFPRIYEPSFINQQQQSLKEPDPICIVGMSFRLPGNISCIPNFWSSISEEETSCFVSDFPANRSHDVLTRMTTPFTSDCVRASFFSTIDQFDHTFFKIAPSEAKHMCPEQRMFLEVSTEALIDSGYNLGSLDGSNIGVYATASEIEYGIIDKELSGVAVVGRQSSVVPSRLSYTFNLKGGNYVVDTACSAALTALEQAVRDLRAGQCEAAVVGGVNIYLYPAKDGLMGTNLIHSASSTCLPFDASADGTASGEGVFAYVLKRTSDAKANGDYIYGTIESICSNSVGRGNGITAPSVDSQIEVIQNALNSASLSLDDIDFLETHGTGTVLGDQIELCALGTVFTPRSERLTIGATKQHFGHLDMAAGFLSILKASCVLSFNTSPGLRHIKQANMYLDQTVFKTETNPQLVQHEKDKSYAGISAYGLSGTNCHAVISVQAEKHEELGDLPQQESFKFLIDVDKDLRVALEEQCTSFSRYIQFYKNNARVRVTLADICRTQVQNLINLNKDQIEVAVLDTVSVEELITKLDSISNGISVFSTAQLKTLDKVEILKYLPKHKTHRAPAFPKFFYKKFRHWLNPVEAEQKSPPPPLSQPNGFNLQEIVSLLQNKSSEVHTLLETAYKLEQLINKFSFDLLLSQDVQGLKVTTSKSTPEGSKSNTCSIQETPLKKSSEVVPLKIYQTSLSNDLTYSKTVELIASIWQDCLGSEKIEECDIFRDLGGDSLLTVQMSKIVSTTFGIKIKAADAFAAPTLSAFSSHVFHTFCQTHKIKHIEIKDLSGIANKMLLFPGQGSQKVNMCDSLKNCPSALKLFEEAKKITGIDILSQCSNPEALLSTEFVQVSLFVGSLAKIAQISVENPTLLQGIRIVGGLSVGEFAALVFADAIDFKDALEIVQFRGKAMQNQINLVNTGMVSIFGPVASEFKLWLINNFPMLKFCTFLGDNQFTVGGPLESCEELVALLEKEVGEQLGIIDARLLRVAGAFHTEYMKQAGVETSKLIDSLNIRYPKFGIIMNANGLIAMNKESIRFNLKKQTASPVMWRDAMFTAYQMGINNFVEISPSSVLTPVLKKRISGLGNCDVSLQRF